MKEAKPRMGFGTACGVIVTRHVEEQCPPCLAGSLANKQRCFLVNHGNYLTIKSNFTFLTRVSVCARNTKNYAMYDSLPH